MAGGFGSGAWGGGPWGGAGATSASSSSSFDIFCFSSGVSMGGILTSTLVTTIGSGSQFWIDSDANLVMASGGTVYPATEAQLVVSESVPGAWTLQTNVEFVHLPNDFSDVTNKHVFFGASDGAGACAGLFVSKVGLAYAGSVHLVGTDLAVDSAFEVLPGSAALVSEAEFLTFRIAADVVTGAVYVFLTTTSMVGVTGHQLFVILPVINASDLAFSATDRAVISVRGTVGEPVEARFDSFCLGNGLLIPNLAPQADAGNDQAVRTCSIVQLDGSASFDPEGSPLTYLWRLIDAPITSSFAFEGADGQSAPQAVPTGYTDHFYSDGLGVEHAVDPVLAGDVLLVGGAPYTVAATGTGGVLPGFYVLLSSQVLADNLSLAAFKLLRQRAISGPDTVDPTIFPDIPGIYKFDLTVNDGSLDSASAPVIVNVLESQVPRGCIPDLGFMWQYFSDFWDLVEDRERIQTFFEAMSQVTASEILTLWQVDYSKSLKDIQRTFQRRWLHYDLLLAEPLPELTSVRQVRGGVLSTSPFPAAGLSGIHGTYLVLESPIFTSLSVRFGSTDPVTVTDFILELESALQAVDARLSVQFVETAVGEGYARIDAPYPFTVADTSTVPVFQVGDSNVHPSGSSGVRLGVRAYRVGRSLEGLDIQADDILTVGGEGYRISRIVDDPIDPYRFSRVIVQRDMPILPGSEWHIGGHVTSRLVDFYNGLVSQDDVVQMEVVDKASQETLLLDISALGASEVGKSQLSVDFDSIDTYVSQPDSYYVRLAKVLRRRYVPVDSLVTDIPALQEFIAETNKEAVLRRNVDFFIEEVRGRRCVRFIVASSSSTQDVWEGANPPGRLWAETTYVDNRPTIEANFGIPAEFTVDDLDQVSSNLDYLSAVRGLWYSYLNGPTLHNLRVGSQILLGLPFAEEAGTIEELRTDFSPNQGRILVRDTSNTAIVRSYTYPSSLGLEINPDTLLEYQVGDAVAQFAPLVTGSEVTDYVKDPYWFEGILNQGIFYEVEKFHKFLMRVDSAAFDLSSLSFVRNFVLRIKPSYTYPLFLIRKDLGDTEISVTDASEFTVTLILADTPGPFSSGFKGQSTNYDDPRSAGGGWRNQFDADADPSNPDPTPFTPDASVTWAWDKQYLSPEDVVTAASLESYNGSATISENYLYADGDPVDAFYYFQLTAPITVTPVGTALPAVTPSTVPYAGSIDQLRMVVWGPLGSAVAIYEVIIAVDGVDAISTSFTVDGLGAYKDVAVNYPVSAGQVLTARVKVVYSGVDQTPDWNLVMNRLKQGAALTWAVGTTPVDGLYGKDHVLT